MSDLLLFAGIFCASLFVWDLWRLIRKTHAALDRDQDILDQIDEPEYPDMDEPHGVIVVDLTMSESDAVLRFVESFRQLKEQHDPNS